MGRFGTVPGGWVLDACCGSASAVVAAHNLGMNAAAFDADSLQVTGAKQRINMCTGEFSYSGVTEVMTVAEMAPPPPAKASPVLTSIDIVTGAPTDHCATSDITTTAPSVTASIAPPSTTPIAPHHSQGAFGPTAIATLDPQRAFGSQEIAKHIPQGGSNTENATPIDLEKDLDVGSKRPHPESDEDTDSDTSNATKKLKESANI